MTRTKEQTEAIITALTKLSEKFYADMDKIVNGVEIYEPDIKIEGGKATFKPIEGIELDPVKYWDQVRIEEVPEPNEEESDFFVFQQSECMPSELSTPMKVVIESEEYPCYNRGTQNETAHGKCEKWCGNDNYCKQSHPEPNEVTEEECQELINEIDQFSRDYDPHGYALPIYKDNDNPNQDMIEIVKKWAIERMNKPPQDTTSQESKDYWKNHYNN